MADWNPYYLAYARSRRMAPEAIQARDRRIWLGFAAVNFAIWLDRRWREWDALTGRKVEFHSNEE